MRRVLILLAVLCSSCSVVVRTEGDCIGRLALGSDECEQGVCSASPDAVITAADADGCVFERWSGSCGVARSCVAREAGRASFARRAWPLRVDATAAAPLEVQLLPSGVRCSGSCDVLIPVGERAEVVAPPVEGRAADFSGDCDAITEDRCSLIGDRPRSVRVSTTAAAVRVRLAVDGAGSVVTPVDTCTASAPCDFTVARGTVLSLQATPDDPLASITWVPSICSTGQNCSLTVDSELQLRVVFSSPPNLSLIGNGPGSVRINGVEHALPYTAAVGAGTRVAIEALAQVDDVVSGFQGLPCEPDRTVETCAFVVNASVQGTISFHRFFQWARGGWSGEVTDLVLRGDGGVLMLGKYQGAGFGQPFSAFRQSVVVALDGDAGFDKVSGSAFGFESANFLELPDGGLWLSGGIIGHRSPGPGLQVVWGRVDAGSTGSPAQTSDHALLEFDEVRFEPIRATVMDLPAGSRVVSVGRGPLLHGEGLLTSFSVNGALDGGPWPLTSIGRFAPDLTLVGSEDVASSVPVDVARYPSGAVSLSLHQPLAPNLSSCSVSSTVARVPVLTFVNASGSCGASAPIPASGLDFDSVGTLSRDSSEPYFTSSSFRPLPLRGPGTQITTGFAHLHSHNAALQQRWVSTLRPLIDVSPQQLGTAIAPTEVMLWNGRVLALFTGQGTGVKGYQADNGLIVRCDPAADSRLLMTLHDPSTGELQWGHCLLQGPVSGDLQVWFRSSRQGLLGRNRQPSTVKAFGGVLLSSWASRTTGTFPVSFFLGSHEVRLDTDDSSYLGLVTPP